MRLKKNFKLRAEVACFRIMSEELRQISRALGIPEATYRQIRLALGEALVNILKHAYPQGAEGSLEVSLEVNESRFCATLIDYGIPFDPLSWVPAENGRCALEGGFGINLMKRMADRLRYRREGEANVLEIVKFLEGC